MEAAVIIIFFWSDNGNRKRPTHTDVLYTESDVFLVGKMICGKNHKCLQVLCGTATTALQLCAPKKLRLLNGSGRYKLLILRLLNGSGC